MSCPPPIVGSYVEIAAIGAALLGGSRLEYYRQNGAPSLKIVPVDIEDEDEE